MHHPSVVAEIGGASADDVERVRQVEGLAAVVSRLLQLPDDVIGLEDFRDATGGDESRLRTQLADFADQRCVSRGTVVLAEPESAGVTLEPDPEVDEIWIPHWALHEAAVRSRPSVAQR